MQKNKQKPRDVSGILILDKPADMTSNASLQYVKRLYHAKKAGHTGSLDAPATGLLPICLGEATKLSSFLLNADKSYRARCRLGMTTTTGDAAGDILTKRPVPSISAQYLNTVLRQFVGKIEQIPPMFSALKVGGKRLYELAYRGIEVKRRPRVVKINKLLLTDIQNDEFELDIHCSKGTYIRTLVADIGQLLGCGAHVKALRRLSVGQFKHHAMIKPELLQQQAQIGFPALDALLLPTDQGVANIPSIRLFGIDIDSFCHGQSVTVKDLPPSGLVRVYNAHGQFIALGTALTDGRVLPKRLIHYR